MSPPLSLHDLERVSTQRSGSATYNFRVAATSASAYSVYRTALVPLMARVRSDPGWMCSQFGDPHIITFDSNFYTFQGLGEYWLATSLDPALSPYVAVSVRQGLCGSAYRITQPASGGSAVNSARVTCARDYALSDGTDTVNVLSEVSATGSGSAVVTIIANNRTLALGGNVGGGGNSALLAGGATVRVHSRGQRVLVDVVMSSGWQASMEFASYGGSIQYVL